MNHRKYFQKIMQGKSKYCLLVLIAALCSDVMSVTEQAPSVRAAMAQKALRLDGKLDDEVWARADAHSDFTSAQKPGMIVSGTEFKVACDQSWIYIGVNCRNEKLHAIEPKVEGHDNGAYIDDGVEVFITSDSSAKEYYHYVLGYGGAKDEARVTDSGAGKYLSWDVPWRAAIDARMDGWSEESGRKERVCAY